MAITPRASAQTTTLPFNLARGGMIRRGVTALALMLAAMTLPSEAHDYKAGDLQIDHPWSRATVPTAKVAAGYLSIKNAGEEADRLVSVESEISERAEIHEMAVNAEGIMTMRPLSQGVEIPAGGSVSLEPGSYHLMFMAPGEGFAAGGIEPPPPSSAPAQAVAALAALGYTPSDAAAAVARVDETLPVQEIIKVALRSLSRAR